MDQLRTTFSKFQTPNWTDYRPNLSIFSHCPKRFGVCAAINRIGPTTVLIGAAFITLVLLSAWYMKRKGQVQVRSKKQNVARIPSPNNLPLSTQPALTQTDLIQTFTSPSLGKLHFVAHCRSRDEAFDAGRVRTSAQNGIRHALETVETPKELLSLVLVHIINDYQTTTGSEDTGNIGINMTMRIARELYLINLPLAVA